MASNRNSFNQGITHWIKITRAMKTWKVSDCHWIILCVRSKSENLLVIIEYFLKPKLTFLKTKSKNMIRLSVMLNFWLVSLKSAFLFSFKKLLIKNIQNSCFFFNHYFVTPHPTLHPHQRKSSTHPLSIIAFL